MTGAGAILESITSRKTNGVNSRVKGRIVLRVERRKRIAERNLTTVVTGK
jgi:hypothetical protein